MITNTLKVILYSVEERKGQVFDLPTKYFTLDLSLKDVSKS